MGYTPESIDVSNVVIDFLLVEGVRERERDNIDNKRNDSM
jgi:hypothetical protein